MGKDMTGCILAKSTAGARGYPQRNANGRNVRLHREAMASHLGRDLDPSEEVYHACHDKRCINPEHLRVGSHADTMRATAEAGRSARGERNGHAKLTAREVIEVRKLHRTGWSIDEIRQWLWFAVTASNVKKIIARKSWRHL